LVLSIIENSLILTD